jgi:tRNA (guanine-N7-)-methyltransferase
MTHGSARVRSYQVRRGRTGPTSRAAYQRLWPVYAALPPYSCSVLEVGFGMGEATALMAAQDPRPLLAVEVHPAGIMSLLRRLEQAELSNVRIVEGDAVDVLHALPEQSLDEVRLYFPDPWPKARHVKRRLVRPAFAELVASRLTAGGFLHLATDIPAYADHCREVLRAWDLETVPRPAHRPVTGYERRALLAGREPVDIMARPH